MFLVNLIIFLAACTILVKSSELLVKAVIKIATFFRLNEFSVGFIIISLSNSLPNIFVGIVAALNKQPQLSLGNSIGANIFEMTLVIGAVSILARNVKMKSTIIKRDLIFMFMTIFMPVILMVDDFLWSRLGLHTTPGISRFDGFLLIVIYMFYLWGLIRKEKLFRKSVDRTSKREAFKYFLLCGMALVLLMVSAEFAVTYANLLSIDLAIPELLVGLFILAIGTTLPELMFDTKAVLSRHEDMAVGDLIGSVIANSTLVLGITAMIYPIYGNMVMYFTSIIFMLLISFVFLTFAESDHAISWKEGVTLILFYVFFAILELYIKSLHV